MAAAELQELPLNVNPWEPLSTAAQKLGDEHDTDAMPIGAGSLMPGAELQVLPLNRKADEFSASTARQKLTVGHDTESGWPAGEDSPVGWLHVVPSYLTAWPDPSTAMQKLADGHDTEVTSSLPWLWSRCIAAPQAGAVLDGEAPAGERAPDPGGADDDPLHPVAAPMSRMDTQPEASRRRPVWCGRLVGEVPVKAVLLGAYAEDAELEGEGGVVADQGRQLDQGLLAERADG
jgi:hypothetical protein